MYHEYRTLIFATLSHQKKRKREVTLIFVFSLIDVCLFDGNSGLFLSLFSLNRSDTYYNLTT